MTAPRRGPGRPRGRAVTVPVLLTLSPESHKAVTAAALAAGLTRVEWLRRAVAFCVATRAPLSHVATGPLPAGVPVE